MMTKTLTAAQVANRNRLLRARQRHVENREMGPEMAMQLAVAESGERFEDLTSAKAD